MSTPKEAYGHCEHVTRTRAANFYYGIRLLPGEKRRAMFAVYGFARSVDDVADGPLASADKQAYLADARAALGSLGNGNRDPVHVALADAMARFDLPVEALQDLVDGVEMDVAGTTYEHFEDLVVYCRRVAGSIGRLCLAIFGADDRERAMPLSDDLGVALQLTNILRDVGEDLELDRVYLPAEDLRRFGCEDLDASDQEAVAELVRFEAARNRQWFERGLALLPHLDRRSASCAAAMSGIYRHILSRIQHDPTEVLRRRVSLPAWEKALVAARSLVATGR